LALAAGALARAGLAAPAPPAKPGEAASVSFLAKTYTLASYNERAKPMWEFTTGAETVDNWTTLVTLIDRPEATSLPQLDQVSEGVMQSYQSAGGRILRAETLKDKHGKPFNFMAASFDDPKSHRLELNFVKVFMGAKNAVVAIYGVRFGDPSYMAKAKAFLDEHSTEVGSALEETSFPPTGSLPRNPH
jgi:hypothetical protein